MHKMYGDTNFSICIHVDVIARHYIVPINLYAYLYLNIMCTSFILKMCTPLFLLYCDQFTAAKY